MRRWSEPIDPGWERLRNVVGSIFSVNGSHKCLAAELLDYLLLVEGVGKEISEVVVAWARQRLSGQ